ncbi:MAG: hypothetical protein H7832_09635 [Magnetococcus sp. DMHC-6]
MEISPTRSALLEARDERLVMQEGFRFLDEKRLLLAAEMMRVLERYEALDVLFRQRHAEAVEALKGAVVRHGLGELQSLPVAVLEEMPLQRREKIFFGVYLAQTEWEEALPKGGVQDSPEARLCQQAFQSLLIDSVMLATLSGNLHRLLFEYRRTERRARALEDVILPELSEMIHEMDQRLEEIDQEESVRVRLRRMA